MKTCRQKDCKITINDLKFGYCNLHRKGKKFNKCEEKENIFEQERGTLIKEQNEDYQKYLEEDRKILHKKELKTENDILKSSFEEDLVEQNKDLIVTIKFKIPAPLNTTLKRTFYKDSLVMEIFRYLDIMFYDDIKNYTLFVYPREEISKDYELNLIGDIINTSCICFIVNNEL